MMDSAVGGKVGGPGRRIKRRVQPVNSAVLKLSSSSTFFSLHGNQVNAAPTQFACLGNTKMAAPAVSRLSVCGVCTAYLHRSVRQLPSERLPRCALNAKRKLHNGFFLANSGSRNVAFNSQSFTRDYFSANTSLERGWVKSGLLAAMRTVVEPHRGRNHSVQEKVQEDFETILLDHKTAKYKAPKVDLKSEDAVPTQSTSTIEPADILPHRRRKRRKSNDKTSINTEESLPLDASSQLTTAAASMPKSATFRRRMATFLSLTKPRLSFLILLTTTSAYSLYPIPEILSSTASSVESSFSTSTLTLLFLTTGTFLSCACANTLNMLFEPKYDALMTRTRNRPLVRNLISRRAAAVFALFCGASGLLLLGFGTNPTVAGLSALNIFLYAGVYTPMKRISAANTWVGAIVGGIPPLMGWCAAAGQTATSEHHSWQDLLFSENALGGWALAALLFAWQFPHFMSLSHTIREDYRNAGHKMLAWTNPARNARVALRYSLAMFPICGFLYWSG